MINYSFLALPAISFYLVIILVQLFHVQCLENNDEVKKDLKNIVENLKISTNQNVTTEDTKIVEEEIFEKDKFDVFVASKKWCNFVKNVDVISQGATSLIKNLTDSLSNLWSEANPFYVENKVNYLSSFALDFATTYKAFFDYFEPIHARLENNAVQTSGQIQELAKENSNKIHDKFRLKWIEINQITSTVHHVFDRFYHNLLTDGLVAINEALNISYPCLLENQTLAKMRVEEQVTYIDNEITSFGEKNQLIRGIERLLRKGIKDWDPRKVDTNLYCYGNNEYGIIFDEFDIVTDATLFLITADIKFTFLEFLQLLNYQIELRKDSLMSTEEEKKQLQDIKESFNEINEKMNKRIGNKVNFVETKELGPSDVSPGPILFKCDKVPPLISNANDGQENFEETSIKYSDEWGKLLEANTRSDSQNSIINETEKVLDPQEGPAKINDTTRGYIDLRAPLFDSSTFAQFTNNFDSYIESELVLSSDGSCAGTCEDYKRPVPTCATKSSSCEIHRKSHCENETDCMTKSRCNTKARRCVKTAPKVLMCPALENSGKLYDWVDFIENESPPITNDTIQTSEKAEMKCDREISIAKERWELEAGPILKTSQYCELCLCICDDPLRDEGQFYFDLTPAVTNIYKNLIATGVRFELVNRTMVLRIEEGEMLKSDEGEIKPETVKWRNISSHALEADATNSSILIPLGSLGFKKMNLDIVHAVGNEVVSGVRFVLVEDRLELQVEFTKIDKSGIIQPPIFEWRSPNWPLPTVPRRKIEIPDLNSPLSQQGPSQPFNLPLNSEFVEFDASSLNLNGTQSVVPFFDVQPVHYVRPLKSVGILYKAKKNSGGFVSPAISIWEKTFTERTRPPKKITPTNI